MRAVASWSSTTRIGIDKSKAIVFLYIPPYSPGPSKPTLALIIGAIMRLMTIRFTLQRRRQPDSGPTVSPDKGPRQPLPATL